MFVLEGLARAFGDDPPEPLVQIAVVRTGCLERADDPEGQVLDAVHLEAPVPEPIHHVLLRPVPLDLVREGGQRGKVALDVGEELGVGSVLVIDHDEIVASGCDRQRRQFPADAVEPAGREAAETVVM